MDDKKEPEAPVAQAMAVPVATVGNTNPLLQGQGFLIRQDRQLIEWLLQDCLGLWCIEYDNKYEFAPLSNQHALRTLSDNAGWRPSQTTINSVPKTHINTESTDCATKCILMTLGCGTCRPFKMDLTPFAAQSESYLHIDREFALGGCLCFPHNATVMVGGQPVAKVVEDWNCSNWLCRYCEASWCCRVPYKVQLIQNGMYADRYNINVNFCACGPHTNFCGSTPCCNDQLWDINEIGTNTRAGRIQRTYGSCSDGDAFLRWFCCHADNFLVEWEDNTTLDERAGMIAATTLIEYVFFENRVPWLYYVLFSAGGNN